MSKTSSSTINQTLTNFASGIAQDLKRALADFIAPPVPVGLTDGQYKQYSDRDAFAAWETARAVGGPANRIEMSADDKYFNCRPHALEIPIDDEERRKAGTNELALEQAKIRALLSGITISHEKAVFDAVGAVSAVSGAGVWSSPEVSPVAELDEQIEAIAKNTGILPNGLVLDLGSWRVAKNHPKVLARFPGAEKVGVSLEQFASLLLNPAIEVKVGVLSIDAAKAPKASNKGFIGGGNAFVFVCSQIPDQYDPSFAKTFMVQNLGFSNITQYRDERSRSDVFASDWSRDIAVVSTLLGRRLAIT